jgi:hypothetical protein
MDTHDAGTPSASCCNAIRAAEPFVFFAGVVLAVGLAIAAVTWEACCVRIGPAPGGPAHAH